MKYIHVSLNELENAVYKAMEGLGYEEGLCVAISKDISFLQAIGLASTSKFVDFLISHKCSATEYYEVPVSVEKKDATVMRAIFHKKSCIPYLEQCCEHIIAKAKCHGAFTVHLEESRDYMFLFPYLQRSLSTACSIHWQDIHNTLYYTTVFTPHSQYPNIILQKISGTQTDKNMLMLYESTTVAHDFFKSYHDIYMYKSSYQCADTFEKSVKQGLLLSSREWAVIQMFSEKVLVPTSEISHHGAGEDADSIDIEDI